MKGLEISRAFWEECGKPMLEERFPELMGLIAVGLVGAGSERYGYDDELSRDHDFEHGFCIYLPDEEKVNRRQEFLLGREYESLPKEFMGLRRSLFNPAGGNRHGVFRTGEVFRSMTGLPGMPAGWRDFLRVPEKLFINNRPAFLVRTLYDGINYGNTAYTKIHAEKRNLFNVRNRETVNKAFHQFDTTTQYYYTHNLYLLVPPKKYFKTHP